MSRSKHQTLKSVFRGLSKGAVDDLAAVPDEDVLELAAKRRIKRTVRRSRKTPEE